MNKTLLLIFLSLLFTGIDTFAQDSISWELPFKKCREINLEKNNTKLLASDNKTAVFISKYQGIVSSVNIESSQENWRTDLGGVLTNEAIIDIDSENLFLITQIESISPIKKSYLWAINVSNGITNWKVEIPYGSILPNQKQEQGLIVLNKNGTLMTFNKRKGTIIWEKKYSSPPTRFYIFGRELIYLQASDHIYIISVSDGRIIDDIQLNKASASIYAQNSRTLVVGDTLGNLSLKNLSSGKIQWQTKVGGYISFIDDTLNGYLVSSYDNFLYLYSKSKGKLIWKKRVDSRITEQPLITSKYVIIASIGNNITDIINLKSGKSINRIILNEENIFINSPILLNKYLMLQTLEGLSLYSNNCGK